MSYYKTFDRPAGSAPLAQNPTDTRVDLLAGVPLYGVESDAPIADVYCTTHFNTPDDAYTLTNGVAHTELDYADPAYTHFTGGTGRSIYYKLNNLSAAEGFGAVLLKQREMGIFLPYRMDVYLSENAIDWKRVYSKRIFECDEKTCAYVIDVPFDCAYRTSWVRIDIDVHAHMWIESFSLYGKTDLSDAVAIVDDGTVSKGDSRIVNRYPTYDELCGVQNIFLAYNCMPSDFENQAAGYFETEHMLPYIGYIKDGEIKDTFFDSALFLPFSRFTYSAQYKCADGWKYYIDNTFAEGKNVDAANDAAKQVSETLGVDHKVKLFFSIFHTKPEYGDFPEKFGDLDGDGIDEDMTSMDDRKKAIKWMIDEQLERYKQKERPYTELVGFYWFEEQVSYNDPMELELIRYAGEYVRSLGYKMIWIPYYQAWGYDEWKSHGFDIACMQPNYAFHKDAKKERLYDNADLCKKFGLCYELEIAGIHDPFDVHKYKNYLDAGVETGFMHSIKMYYQGGKDFYSAFCSDNKLTHSVYDDTYLFAKEKLVKCYREE